MKNYLLIFTILFLSSVLIGCNRPNPEPETLDPIYKDLVESHRKLEGKLAEQKKMLEDTLVDLKKAEAGSVEAKILKKDYSVTSQNIQNLTQQIAFIKIRAERRKFTDRMTYKYSFEAKKEWPDPREYSDYLLNKRLNEASRHWSDRVPRLNDRYPSSKHEPAAKKEASAGH